MIIQGAKYIMIVIIITIIITLHYLLVNSQ